MSDLVKFSSAAKLHENDSELFNSFLLVQEGSEQALYFDADILDVQRRRHDVRGCRCRFWVRYRHDQTEVVPDFILLLSQLESFEVQ